MGIGSAVPQARFYCQHQYSQLSFCRHKNYDADDDDDEDEDDEDEDDEDDDDDDEEEEDEEMVPIQVTGWGQHLLVKSALVALSW